MEEQQRQQQDFVDYVIPINLSVPRPFGGDWKPGEADSLARGISARIQRETQEQHYQALLALDRKQPPFGVDAQKQEKDALAMLYSPLQQSVYRVAKRAIRESQGRAMDVVLFSSTSPPYGSKEQLYRAQPALQYAIDLIVSELREKGWRPHLRFDISYYAAMLIPVSTLSLCCDFTQ